MQNGNLSPGWWLLLVTYKATGIQSSAKAAQELMAMAKQPVGDPYLSELTTTYFEAVGVKRPHSTNPRGYSVQPRGGTADSPEQLRRRQANQASCYNMGRKGLQLPTAATGSGAWQRWNQRQIVERQLRASTHRKAGQEPKSGPGGLGTSALSWWRRSVRKM